MAGEGELDLTPAGEERRGRQRAQAGLGQSHRVKVDSRLWGTLDGDSGRTGTSPEPSGCLSARGLPCLPGL